MLRAKGVNDEGRDQIIFGLSHENVARLLDRQPIHFKGETLGDPGRDYTIFVEPTEKDLVESLRAVNGGRKLPDNNWLRDQ